MVVIAIHPLNTNCYSFSRCLWGLFSLQALRTVCYRVSKEHRAAGISPKETNNEHKIQAFAYTASDCINLYFLVLVPTKADIRQVNILLNTWNVGTITRPSLGVRSWLFPDIWWSWDWRDWVISCCLKVLSHFAFNQWDLCKLQKGLVAWVWIQDFSGVAKPLTEHWVWFTFSTSLL